MGAESPLVAWRSFFVVVGSAGASLTGLQFVVVTLMTESRMEPSSRTLDAFATPTVVHFCIALVIAAGLSAPWPSMFGANLLLAACGLYGMGYVVTTVRHARRQKAYKPVAADWIWYAILPAVAHAALLAAATTLAHHTLRSLFIVAGVCVSLLLIGIHNAWDAVTYVATSEMGDNNTGASSQASQAT